MSWPDLSRLLGAAMLVWLAAVLAIVLVRMLRGDIPLVGLIGGGHGHGVDFHRLQLLAATLLFVAIYVFRAIKLSPGSALPDIPPLFLAGLIGSQSTYLIGKYLSR